MLKSYQDNVKEALSKERDFVAKAKKHVHDGWDFLFVDQCIGRLVERRKGKVCLNQGEI